MNLHTLSNRRSFTRLAVGIGGGTLALALAGCGGAASASGPATEISLTATEFAYTPAQVKVAAPGQVKITLANQGVVEHDFVITGVSGKLAVKAHETGSAIFNVPKAGTYQFVCSVEGHKDAGMKGTLTVG